ncbi:MAG: oxidative damage protection protein [Terriglobia bacterium]
MGCSGPTPTPTPTTGKHTVKCVKFRKELPGLDEPPWPGELGQRVYENVSKDAWELWKERLKMILNEYRLSPWTKEAHEIIEQQMEEFFFGEGAALPPGYAPPQSKG